MAGGMSHLDTLDTKPGAANQGPTPTIATAADGLRISGWLPQLAKQMQDVAVVRSLTSTQGAHEQGRYYVHTGYVRRGTITHPGYGAWLLHFSGRRNNDLPGNVLVGGSSDHPGAGFLEPGLAPLPLGKAESGLDHAHLPEGVDESRAQRRLALAQELDQDFLARFDQAQVRAYSDFYDEALRLMKSRDLAAFDLSKEPDALRDAYGRNNFGQGCLLARRLVEHDVRFVEVTLGGWDTHNDNFELVEQRSQILDNGLATLIADLRRRGLLEETLVVLATEFGRSPEITPTDGRNHHPAAFSSLLAGGGIAGGQAWGTTDAQGARVIENPVSVPDFNATIAHALGLPVGEIVHDRDGRPFTIGAGGTPVHGLF
jgi:hypothetical protein